MIVCDRELPHAFDVRTTIRRDENLRPPISAYPKQVGGQDFLLIAAGEHHIECLFQAFEVREYLFGFWTEHEPLTTVHTNREIPTRGDPRHPLRTKV